MEDLSGLPFFYIIPPTNIMYITNWEEFQKAAEELYIASPELVTTNDEIDIDANKGTLKSKGL